MAFINFSELYNAGGSFARQEVLQNGTTTTIYGGYAPAPDPTPDTDARKGWIVRKLIVEESGSTQRIQCLWARGTWDSRAELEYQYYLS